MFEKHHIPQSSAWKGTAHTGSFKSLRNPLETEIQPFPKFTWPSSPSSRITRINSPSNSWSS